LDVGNFLTEGAGHRSIGVLRSLVWLLALQILLAACYSQVAVQPAGLTVGALATVRLSLDGTQELARVLGPEIRSVTGVVRPGTTDSVILEVRESRTLSGQLLSSSGTRVAIPSRLIAELSLRTVNKRRSWITMIVAVATAITLVVAAAAATGGGGGSGGGDGPPPPT
jgi:hypothetical protein